MGFFSKVKSLFGISEDAEKKNAEGAVKEQAPEVAATDAVVEEPAASNEPGDVPAEEEVKAASSEETNASDKAEPVEEAPKASEEKVDVPGTPAEEEKGEDPIEPVAVEETVPGDASAFAPAEEATVEEPAEGLPLGEAPVDTSSDSASCVKAGDAEPVGALPVVEEPVASADMEDVKPEAAAVEPPVVEEETVEESPVEKPSGAPVEEVPAEASAEPATERGETEKDVASASLEEALDVAPEIVSPASVSAEEGNAEEAPEAAPVKPEEEGGERVADAATADGGETAVEEDGSAEVAPASDASPEGSGFFSKMRSYFWVGTRPDQKEEEELAGTETKGEGNAVSPTNAANVVSTGPEGDSSSHGLEDGAGSPEGSSQEVPPAAPAVEEPERQEAEAAPDAPAPASAPEEAPAAPLPEETPAAAAPAGMSPEYAAMTVRLREAEPRLSAWLAIVLEGVEERGDLLNERVTFLLRSLDAPEAEIQEFVGDFASWLEKMDYYVLDEFRSELQYRLALALDLEDEEDERSRLFVRLSESLSKTREQFTRRLEGLFASHGELDDEFWEEMEELFIMADLGYDAALTLVSRLKERARKEGVTTTEGARELLRSEIKGIFAKPRRISGINPPEVVLMIGVNGAGKTTTIAKLAYRDKMQGRKVMIAAADTFRAAAIDQMRVWAERVGTLFHAKQPGSDPASVAYEAMDRALAEGVDVLYVDTAGRLQTKVNLMSELHKIRQVIGKKHPGAPHRTVLVLDATTGQNALSQAKLFKESAEVDELILTKLDGTAKGGVAIAVSLEHGLPITYVGLGEKVEDLRPFNGDDYADALITSV